jgi:CRP/FNR family cyclic AMP-dependent transcriptional regulator
MLSSSVTMRDLVREAVWARQLTPEQLRRVERETFEQHFAAGDVVCREGQPAEHWIGVIDGMVKVDTTFAGGRATTFIGVSNGGWLGEGSLLKRELRPYEVVALRGSRIAFMPRATFDWLYQTSLPFSHFLINQLNARLGQFVSLVETIRMQSTVGQVATSLAELFNPALCPQPSEVLQISQEEIARLSGLSRPITNRALHQLQDEGFVKIQYGSIQVLDVQALHKYARDFDGQAKVH